MAQLGEYLALDFSSGHDLTVPGIKLCANGAEPAWDLLCLCPFPALCLNDEKRKKHTKPNQLELL